MRESQEKSCFERLEIGYSQSAVMEKRFIAAHAILSLAPRVSLISTGAEAGEKMNVDVLSDEQRRELREFAMSYTERLFVTGNERELWIVSPSLFPSATLCVAIRPYIPPREMLRFIKDEPELFEISRYIDFGCARMSSRLNEKREAFWGLVAEIRKCFCDIYRLEACGNERDRVKLLAEQCGALSLFAGCPIEFDASVPENDGYAKTDFSLFTAFVLNMLMVARECSPTRSAAVSIRAKRSAALVEVRFSSDASRSLSAEQLTWTRAGNDKGLFCYFDEEGDNIVATLHPLRDDRLYVEIKQRFEFKLK